MRYFIMLLFVPICIVACMPTHQTEVYVHKPTQRFTKVMTMWEVKKSPYAYEEASRIVKRYKNDVIIVPRFREFSRGGRTTNNAYVYFITKKVKLQYILNLSLFEPLIENR